MARSFHNPPTRPAFVSEPQPGNSPDFRSGQTNTVSRFVSKNNSLLFVSVIVPVWNDAERLRSCLDSLEAQTYPNHSYEVIVVDNNSTEATVETPDVAHVVSSYAHARVIYESTPGSYSARNTGVANSRGEIVAFTDSDCVPARDWIERGVSHLTDREGDCAVVAGRIEIFPRLAARPNAVEQYEALIALAQKQFVKKYKFGATANLFAFREVFAKVGPFLAEVKSGGDLEWGRRVTDYGFRLEYSEDARVYHPARASLSQLYSKIVRVTGGLHDLKRLRGSAYLEFDRSVFMDLLPPVRAIASIMREPSLIRGRDRIKVSTVLCFVRFVQAFEKSRLAFPKLWNHHTSTR